MGRNLLFSIALNLKLGNDHFDESDRYAVAKSDLHPRHCMDDMRIILRADFFVRAHRTHTADKGDVATRFILLGRSKASDNGANRFTTFFAV